MVIRSGDNKIIINLTILWFEAKNYTAEGSHVRVWVVGRLNMILALRQFDSKQARLDAPLILIKCTPPIEFCSARIIHCNIDENEELDFRSVTR